MRIYWQVLALTLFVVGVLVGSWYWYIAHLSPAPLDPDFADQTVARTPAEAISKVESIEASKTRFLASIQDHSDNEKKALTDDFFKMQWLPIADNAVRIAIISQDASLINFLVKVTNENRKLFPDGQFSHVLLDLVYQHPTQVQAAIGLLSVEDQALFVAHIREIQSGWSAPPTPAPPPTALPVSP